MPDRGAHHHRPDWHGPPGRFVRRRMLFGLIAFAVFASIVGTVGAVVFAAVSRPGPWLWLLLTAVVFLLFGGREMRRTFRPVGELIDATVRLGDGEQGVRVHTRGVGPIAPVVASFNRMAARLDDEDERRRRFLGDIGHELKNPIAVLRGEIEALIDGVRPADESGLRSLLDDVDTVERLVEDLRTLTLTEAGRLELHTEPLDVAALVDEAVGSAGHLLRERGVTLDAGHTGDTIARVDPNRIRQVVWNLVTNALRAMPTGGTLSIRVDGRPDRVVIWVADTGRGIDPEQLDTLFDRFVKSSDSRGSGLGLTIVRDLVHAHGGTIDAANRHSGGASFTVELPRRGQPPPVSPTSG